MVSDILIIGGGVAALTAALYASRGGLRATIIEKNSIGGQIADSPKVENFPTIESISGTELTDRMYEQVTRLGTNIEFDEIVSLEKKEDIFIAKGLYDEYYGKSVILATGVTHRHLNIPSEEAFLGKGVSYCAVCDGPFYEGKRTMVIGDGNSALQYAIMLSKTSSHVDIVTLTDSFFGDKALVETLKSLSNVSIVHNLRSIAFKGEEKLKSVSFENVKTGEQTSIETDGCFVAIGQIPNNKAFENLVDLKDGFIETDESMATKTKGLFASGDCRNKKVRQLTTACNDGAIAALSAISYLSSL